MFESYECERTMKRLNGFFLDWITHFYFIEFTLILDIYSIFFKKTLNVIVDTIIKKMRKLGKGVLIYLTFGRREQYLNTYVYFINKLT